ncbi:hypothetical protein ACFYSH_18515 [Streptomyces sp. NPDC005791]|uniref:hypothetical protein n=1 Tax=Streptomyces sp. NPDC005791 TaxID=3364732 RepID=UPI0036B42EB0
MPTALVTGGTTGIGRAAADLSHAGGYQVAVADARVLAHTDALLTTVSERFRSLDLLFVHAGIFRPAPVADVTEELWRRRGEPCWRCCPRWRSNWLHAGSVSMP